MASKSSAKTARRAPSTTRRPRPRKATAARPARAAAPSAGFADLSKMARLMTPEQAFELYRANARIALDVIDAALAGTAKLRRLQFEAEEDTRSMQQRAARHVATSSDPQALVAAGREVTGEAVEKAMRYWRQMFEMIVEMQKRLFALMQEQASGVPGAKQARTLMAMMPDVGQAQSLVDAMQRVMSSGGSAFRRCSA